MSLYDDASLIMYPSGYKSGKIYCQKPTDGSGDLTFTRASTATRVNESGLIEEVASGVPRIDYTGGGCGKLLLEPQRTNLYLNSEPTANEGPAGNISYVTADFGLGFSNYIYFGDSSVGRYRYGGTCLASTQYTLSVFVKMDNGLAPLLGTGATKDFCIVIANNALNSGYVTENYGNGIYRVSATATSGTTNLVNNGVLKYDSQTDEGFKVVGWQLEAGAYPTSYIPTEGSTVTRVADASNTSGLTAFIGQTEGVLFLDITNTRSSYDSTRAIQIDDATDSNRVQIGIFGGNITPAIVTADVLQAAFSTPFVLGRNKMAFAYKTNDFVFYLNGSLVGSDVSGTVPATSLLRIGGKAGSASLGDGVNNAMLFKTRLTNAELAALTTL